MEEKEKEIVRLINDIMGISDLKLTIAFPATNNGWYEEVPELIEKEIVISDNIISIEPYQWGTKQGYKVYFLPEGKSASHWHFVVKGLPL
jgi:hypothetical protein